MDGERLCHDRKGKVVGIPGVLCSAHGLQKLECFSDEVDSRGGEEEEKDASCPPAASGRGDGLSVDIEAGKRRRGRPPGSINKPKPPVVVTQETMRPYILEIPGGGDIAGALAGFARRRGLGICVLAGTGAVANVSLRHPSPSAEGGAAAAAIVFNGRYEILSISATFLPPSMSAAVTRALGGLSISLAGPHGQIVGGAVAGPLVAAAAVVVVAAAFTSPTFHRLPADDVDASASVSGSGEADEQRGNQLEPLDQHHVDRCRFQPQIMASATRPVSLHERQRHDEVWAAAASTPRPRPPYQ